MFVVSEDDIPKMLSSEPSPLNIVIKSEEEDLEYCLLLFSTLREIILKLVFTFCASVEGMFSLREATQSLVELRPRF